MTADKKNSETKKTVALKYNQNTDRAPKIIASGKGSIAEMIIKKARQENIPIREDKDVVQVLAELNIGDEIPEELYTVIAEILSFFYDLEDLQS
ncbi:EscU/YscU/HrcU family type III secretion system export apparatus switch protein [Halanaerobium saccharolyticum]|jgi:flagellar biosynthesis protein|uniref:Flagellar biosynthesis protein n=1 Tax=Halanaerobium saccharolyticum TaxID=43595 RepID=A0A2T5RRB3_9FIRM|nr:MULTISPECIES: EscU/YscU/HrcU family type III secretion system export apparatus switch protein [Halanaerobium]OEG61827.1 MAG: flagellar biosynthesis protein FlhB [Halanaerobium sp. MDAL1]PTW02690.1 flagellar biosynthesis protein [Halanaerobium saccharolyticum]PUU90663.1 MAG: flagellar biosynthesis protein [Halanaerobium sp.]PUU95171.1 MAG: flagellar biosynthesis protein [Halanaerobium sp.]TDP91244.1 flagellar biosynthesis protein [Halanaerobium saccharolyticum]